MPSMDFEVFCSTCGAGMCSLTDVEIRSGRIIVNIESCPTCREESYNKGYSDRDEKED